MELFFERDQVPRFHVREAAILDVDCEPTFPPRIVAAGLAPHLQLWHPSAASDGQAAGAQFVPQTAVRELDGRRFLRVHMLRDAVVGVTACERGKVVVWDPETLERMQVVDLGGRATCSSACGDFVAVGQADGTCCVLRRRPKSSPGHIEYLPLFSSDLKVDMDGAPLLTAHLEQAPGGGPTILMAHSPARNSYAVWNLADGKVVKSWAPDPGEGRVLPPVAASAVSATVVVSALWTPGRDPQVLVLDYISGEGGFISAEQRLAGCGRPLKVALGPRGVAVAIAFESGALCGFGRHGFRLDLPAPVTALCSVPPASTEGGGAPGDVRFVAGDADGRLYLVAEDGTVLHRARPGTDAITSLACTLPLFVVAGTAEGRLEVVSLVPSGAGEDAGAGAEGAGGAREDFCVERCLWADAQGLKGVGGGGRLHARVGDLGADVRDAIFPEGGVLRTCTDPRLLRDVEGVGVAKFKRCGRCKSRWYCSEHCQRTDWRNGHKSKCAELAEEHKRAMEDRERALQELKAAAIAERQEQAPGKENEPENEPEAGVAAECAGAGANGQPAPQAVPADPGPATNFVDELD
ncbi:unnamed protein product [Pedinophyceae sp. YPF-701]|nr:unnamed protein product [Pedinophyceae sp. YPF-701]